MTTRILVMGACLALLGSAAAAETPFTLPVPTDWRTETIPFPLGFAPELPYTGLEELRFAPGMFQLGAEDYWSYAFVWWVPEGTPLDSKLLEADLTAYFSGLTRVVAEAEHFEPNGPVHEVVLTPRRTAVGANPEWTGTATTFDAFAARANVDLRLEIEAMSCPDEGATAVWFAISPQPEGHGVWRVLHAIRAGFSCLPAD